MVSTIGAFILGASTIPFLYNVVKSWTFERDPMIEQEERKAAPAMLRCGGRGRNRRGCGRLSDAGKVMPISSRAIATRRQARPMKPMVMAPFRWRDAQVAGVRAGDRPETALEGQVRPKPVERDHEEHGRVALTPKDATDRLGDLGGGERGGRDLVEQRLEQVVVVPVDDGDPTAGA